MATPPLGWIEPKDRTPVQAAAHADALAHMPRFAAAGAGLAAPTGPVKVILGQFWKAPEVIADVGFEFTGFFQYTGSCVGVSRGNADFTVQSVQRTLNPTPNRVFVPFWPFAYGRTRYLEGDRGQGEGAVDSVCGQQLKKEGDLPSTLPGLPQFIHGDGLRLSSSIELQWSDGGSRTVTQWLGATQNYTGTLVPTNNPQDEYLAIVNGYPILSGCDYYVSGGSIHGTGDTAYVRGRFDGRGGHSTCRIAVWDHPNDGRLFGYSNQWPGSTYPTDPAGLPRCCCWVPESEVQKVYSQFHGGNGETMAVSHVDYLPAQPEVLNWMPW